MAKKKKSQNDIEIKLKSKFRIEGKIEKKLFN